MKCQHCGGKVKLRLRNVEYDNDAVEAISLIDGKLTITISLFVRCNACNVIYGAKLDKTIKIS